MLTYNCFTGHDERGMRMYTICVNTYAKVFSVVMRGNLAEDDSRSFAEEFQNKVSTIVPSDYALLFDTKDIAEAPHCGSDGFLTQARALAHRTPFKAQYSFAPIRVVEY